VAIKDDVIPLSKPYMDRQGRMHDSVPVQSGDRVPIQILLINRSKEIWGEDAHQWK
jgi:hypothetical protein